MGDCDFYWIVECSGGAVGWDSAGDLAGVEVYFDEVAVAGAAFAIHHICCGAGDCDSCWILERSGGAVGWDGAGDLAGVEVYFDGVAYVAEAAQVIYHICDW